MKKKCSLILLIIFLIPVSVFGLEECMREETLSNIPCNLITTWTPDSDCSTYSVDFYNESGSLLKSSTLGDIGDSGRCNITFNYSSTGQYYINSTIQSWNVKVGGNDNMLIILLIPLGICFLFIYLSNSLDEIHNPLKWFFKLLALIMVFIIYQGAYIILSLDSAYSELTKMFNITVYGWIFWTIMAYLLIYIIYNIFMSFKHSKKWDFNERFMK